MMKPELNNNQASSSSEELEIIKLSETAISEVKRRLSESMEQSTDSAPTSPSELGLRLGVKGGGCSGLSYVIDVGSRQENDHINTHYGFPIFIDPKSGLYLKGVVLDYEGGFLGNGFKFNNPNATNTCGCGESFAL